MGSQRVEQNSICHSGLRKPILFFIFFFGSCDAAHLWITFSLFLLHFLHLFLDIDILSFSLNNFIYSEYTAAAAAKSLESCLTLWPHRQQPTRLPRHWDSPGKNTGVGCHYLLQCMKVKSESEVTQSCWTLSDPMDCSLPDSSVHGIFQARVLEWVAIAFSTEYTSEVAQSCPTLCDPVDCSLPGSSIHKILQARRLEWVTISFSRGSSQPRDLTRVSRIGGRHFNLWATREAH